MIGLHVCYPVSEVSGIGPDSSEPTCFFRNYTAIIIPKGFSVLTGSGPWNGGIYDLKEFLDRYGVRVNFGVRTWGSNGGSLFFSFPRFFHVQ